MDNKRQLLIEGDAGITVNKPKIISINESTSETPSNVMTVDCILQKANTENRNGRIYPKHILERENTKFQELIKTRSAFNSTDHPDSSTVSLKYSELSHLVVRTWWEGDTLMGTLEILTSKKYETDGQICCIGDFIAMLLEKGCKLGISSRGLGSLKKVQGKNYVQDDFELICFDLVSSPSTPNAYLFYDKPINESYEIYKKSPLENKLLNFLGNI